MDQTKIEKGVKLILEGMGEDSNREGIKETPTRVARMFLEIFEGMQTKPELSVGFTEEISRDNYILIKDIPFYSFCEHHLLPFFGKVKILYIPKDNRVAGFSELVRVVDLYSRRLQIQERLTNQIADKLMETLKPTGLRILIEATQLCVTMRDRRALGAQTVTHATRGNISIEQIPKELL
jgi:GTP cyclohydrolase I